MNCSIFDLDDKDFTLCQRQLMAYHTQQAYKMQVDQARQSINEAQRR